MELQKFLKKLSREQIEKLASAQTAQAVAEAVRDFGFELNEDESEEVFASLFPVRGKELDDDVLALITGGAAPRPTRETHGGFSGIRL